MLKPERIVNMFKEYFEEKNGKTLSDATNREIYESLLAFTGEQIKQIGYNTGKKKLYYISAEFLVGKLLINNLINIGLFDKVSAELEQSGKSIEEIQAQEPEPSLGNGGLGRLAACFADSIATLGLYGDGVGLNYHCGLFRQKFVDNCQTEEPDFWIEDKSWLKKTGTGYTVKYKDFSLKSVLYDLDVTGHGSKSNRLRLFDIEGVDEGLIKTGIKFNKKDVDRNLTLFLYPDDSDEDGKKLRVYQQYFMVSNAAQLIIEEAEERGSDLHDLYEYAVVQINDTHPALIIPELIRLLQQKGIDFYESAQIVKKMCAYTNHTILAEALEKWPVSYIEDAVPNIAEIIKCLDSCLKSDRPETRIIIDGKINMAHLAIHYSYSVNGVAALHTDILKETELKSFYELYPEKFNNKTNGITFRRWLIQSNPELTELIRSLTGDGFLSDADRLADLAMYKDDNDVLSALMHIKRKNKLKLCDFLAKNQSVMMSADSVFDIQAKRLHEYKRQQMNALYVIKKYLEIKDGILPKRHLTFVFAAKAAPAYTAAKDIIHLILCLSQLIAADKTASEYMTVVMVENYNVTAAQRLIPACDISEQISLASKEASGTGNMKFMLNGALTLGTADGANVEIAELVGRENIYIFGKTSDEVISLIKSGRYNPRSIYSKDAQIRRCVDFITDEAMLKIGKGEQLRRLQSDLINNDRFMALLDFDDYSRTKDGVFEDYENRSRWAKKTLINIAGARFFSSDRTIAEYNKDIWKL